MLCLCYRCSLAVKKVEEVVMGFIILFGIVAIGYDQAENIKIETIKKDKNFYAYVIKALVCVLGSFFGWLLIPLYIIGDYWDEVIFWLAILQTAILMFAVYTVLYFVPFRIEGIYKKLYWKIVRRIYITVALFLLCTWVEWAASKK